MCGIFGVFLKPGAAISNPQLNEILTQLFRLSESRGKESAGVHVYLPAQGEAWTLKVAQRASELLQSREYRDLLQDALAGMFPDSVAGPVAPIALLAHSRLVTNGAAELARNNQPVRWGGVTMIHNGIIVNVDELWASNKHLTRNAEVDTEVMAALAADALSRGGGPIETTAEVFARLRGAASIAMVHEDGDWAVLATNTGDLYWHTSPELGCTVFASERFILDQALASFDQSSSRSAWLAPGHALLLSLSAMQVQPFRLDRRDSMASPLWAAPRRRQTVQHELAAGEQPAPAVLVPHADESLLHYGEERVKNLRRCTRCVLPETFPFIKFDDEGVCNYCRHYRPRYRGKDPVVAKRDFIDSLERYRSSNGSPDVIVAFSGGRDSSYGLHLIKKEFNLTPITFTYDWGMVTDLARRNIARICGQLGIQNILVSADIRRKRDNIRKNVVAWLRKPDLGLVPLFMAGDKHFFKVVNLLKRQTGIRLDLWCANPLENTDFKAGFCGVPPDFGKTRVDYLSIGRKARMAAYYAARFVANPRYLNDSIPDTAGAFLSYYFEPRRDFYFIFDHIVWNEEEVNRTLLDQYDWELAPDTPSTWRIGDGTAPFYNYIYMTARGFSEFDTFRSNQIREGMLNRDDALAAIAVENRPRAESLRWYLDTIGLDFNDTVRRINALDRLGLHQ